LSITDPRRFVKDLLKAISVSVDDDVTPAQMISILEDGPDNVYQLFYIDGIDAVITVGRHSERESGDGKRIQGIPIRYDAEVPVYVSSVNKSYSTAPLTLNKVRRAIIAAIENAALYTAADLSVISDGNSSQVMGGHDPLWMDRYLIRVRPMPPGGGSITPDVLYYGFELISGAYKFEDGFERVWI
jgi:hypothetical protein